jgi:diphthamide biosynthesis protein 2
VLCGLEYAHALVDLKGAMAELCKSDSCNYEIQYADVLCSEMSPSSSPTAEEQCSQSNESTHNDDLPVQNDDLANFVNSCCNVEGSMRKYNLGGLTWSISIDAKIDDYLLYWIGEDNSAFANVALTFNKCDIGLFLSSTCSIFLSALEYIISMYNQICLS